MAYRAIVLPFGLIQVFRDWEVFDPGSDEFDPVRAAEYAASPLHYVFGRDSTDTGDAFVTAIRTATLSRDLNDYRGFTPASEIEAAGLARSSWGGTITLHRGRAGGFQDLKSLQIIAAPPLRRGLAVARWM